MKVVTALTFPHPGLVAANPDTRQGRGVRRLPPQATGAAAGPPAGWSHSSPSALGVAAGVTWQPGVDYVSLARPLAGEGLVETGMGVARPGEAGRAEEVTRGPACVSPAGSD